MSVAVLGGINWDVVTEVAALPRPGETVLATGLRETPGGKALNQAVAAARYGAATRLFGAVGDDAPGAALRRFLAAEGIDTAGVVIRPGCATGRAHICLAAAGENSIVVVSGANARFGADEAAAAEGDVLVAQFEAEPGAIRTFLSSPAARSGRTILNAAPARLEHRDLLALADILILNETELEAFADAPLPAGDHAAAIALARRVRAGAAQAVVLTLGPAGCLVIEPGRVTPVAGHRVAAVDTIGAGDCFVGTLAAALDAGAALVEAARHANAAAALAVGRPGAAAAMPDRAALDAFLTNQVPAGR